LNRQVSALPSPSIELRGVRVHNLRGIDLDLPRGRLIAFCGVSGSGKTSLALDTLYAEGQRRFIESFSAYTRQFLERLEKPEAERIDGLPPAVAVTGGSPARSARATIGTATEIYDNLRLLFARIGQLECPGCGRRIERATSDSVAEQLASLPEGTRFMVAFPPAHREELSPEALREQLLEEGFQRALAAGRTVRLSDEPLPQAGEGDSANGKPPEAILGGPHVVVDRLTASGAADTRLRDSIEIALAHGAGKCIALVEPRDASAGNGQTDAGTRVEIDGRPWEVRSFNARLRCDECGHDFAEPAPRLFSFNSPLGACSECEGFGNVVGVDMDLVVPDPGKTLAEGAIAPWNTPAYAHELEELLALADDYGIPCDVPFRELTEDQLRLIREGVPERDFGGLNGFFAWLERRKYKTHIRVFLSRWRSYSTCPKCGGARLREQSLAWRIGGRNVAQLCQMPIGELIRFLDALQLSEHQQKIAHLILEQVGTRLNYLQAVGLDYLALDRTLRTLSGGEAQRIALTAALGSSLVNILYVLDEPSVGLHPHDVQRLVAAIDALRRRGNTVVVVEHEEAILRASDQVVELGPGAGRLGGEVVFQGTVDELLDAEDSLTSDYLAGRRGVSIPNRRADKQGRVKLTGAAGHNLKKIDVEFPLGLLALVTGVSGCGKTTLVQHTLYPALCQRKRKDGPRPLPLTDVYGDGQIDDVVLVDQSAIGRSLRSNPVTYIKAFDAIRAVFAETLDARTHNYKSGHFSFNSADGRCTACNGDGFQQIDMQFMADVLVRCPACRGRRYRPEILDVRYRDRNIADVLEMTVREAFSFFRGQTKVQSRLKPLIDVGLEYLQLGQPAATLSAGEAQRLKLASYLGGKKRGRTLFLLDEPTTGLHFSDIVKLLDCFEALLSVGHSLIVVEHNLQMMKAADWIIDLGPGAGNDGGRLIAQGTPEQVAEHADSLTGKYLSAALKGTD